MKPDRTQPLADNDLIFCDFDGTISVIDTGIAIIDALDLDEAWEIEYIWRRGEISSMECLRRQFAMVQMPADSLHALLDTFPLHEDFRDFFELIKARRAHLVVVSDGLDFYVDYLLGRFGYSTCEGDRVLDRQYDCIPRFANHATVTDHGVEIEFPHQCDTCSQCGNCKVAHLFRLRPEFERVIYLGDGFSDMCPAKYADVLFAKDHLAQAAETNGMRYHPFESFEDVIAVLQ